MWQGREWPAASKVVKVGTYSLTLAFVAFVLQATLILRARQGGFLSRLPLFYSYIAYTFFGAATAYAFYWLQPTHYPTAFWFYFLVDLLAEFGVLAEVSDQVFNPYPAIRRLGRFFSICICLIFSSLYIFPSLLRPRASDVIILDLVKRSSLTKAVIIIALLAAARYFRLPLGRNVSGILLGFALFLGTNVANFALAERLGPVLYGPTFIVIGPLSYTLRLLVWTIALWRYEPAMQVSRKYHEHEEEIATPLSYQLGRFNTALTRLLRR